MEASVKFSVMVPVYKVEKYIRECIESVLNQSYENFELILVDDGSPDESGRICEEYAAKDGRIKVFHKPNGGLMHTRRYALEKASGDYMVFLDSDDYIALDTLEVLEGYIRQSNADCIVYGIEWLKPDGTESVVCSREYQGRLITDKRDILNLVLNDQSYNALCRKCVRASCFDGRDFSPYYHIKSGEDRIQSIEILENAESFLFIPESLYYYRVNPGSITHTENYDGYKADFTVEECCLAMAERLAVLSAEDYDRHRNFVLNGLVIELKKLCRFCSDRANTVQGFENIRNSSYYKNFLSAGYRSVPPLPGVAEISGLRRRLNKLLTGLLNKGAYGAIIFICRHVYTSR